MRGALPGTRLGCPRTGCTGLGEGLAFAATAQACRFRRGRALGSRAGIYERRRETRVPAPGTGACGLRRGTRVPGPRTGVRALARDLPSESRTGMRGACEGRAQKSRAPGGTRLPGMRDGSRRFRRVRAHGLRAWMYEHRREVRVPGARNRGMRPPARDAHSRSPYGRAGSCTGLASRVSTLRCAALARGAHKKAARLAARGFRGGAAEAGLLSATRAYFFSASRMSRSSSTSSEGAAGAAGAFLCSVLISLTTTKMAKAMMTNWMTVLMKSP